MLFIINITLFEMERRLRENTCLSNFRYNRFGTNFWIVVLTSPEEIYEWKFVICLITYDCFKTNQNYYNTRHFIFQFMSGYTCMKTVEWVFNNKLTFLNLNLTTGQLSTRRCVKIKWIPSFSTSGITITEVAEVMHRGG